MEFSEIINICKDTGLHTMWRHKLCGILLAISTGILYFKYAFTPLEEISFYYIEYWLWIILVLFVIFIWGVLTHRIFFRDGWKILVWFFVWLIITSTFPLCIYTLWIKNTELDLPYILLWGSIITAICSYYIILLIKHRLFRDDRIIIVFAISSNVQVSESMIRESIESTICDIESSFPSIKIIVPPFGYVNRVTKCEKYITRRFTQADALIFAKIMPGIEDGNIGYIYTGFTSVVNNKRHKNLNIANNTFLDKVLHSHSIEKEWNTFNISKNNAISKLRIANNLKGMLLMYCSALYMFKNEFISALPIARQMFNIENNLRSNTIAKTAKDLLSLAYLASAVKYEHQQHDYQQAYSNLNECLKIIPSIRNNVAFIKSMARLEYYRGDIKASRKYTREFKQLEGNSWGYYLNMGFYALCENKMDEWVNWYKKLSRHQPHPNEVIFAIEFLTHEYSKYKDSNIALLIEISILYLKQYINRSQAIKEYSRKRNKIQDQEVLENVDVLFAIKSESLTTHK